MTQAPSSSPIETDAEPDIATGGAHPYQLLPDGLTADDMVEVCRQMILVRTMDERIWMMNRQGKVPIAASCQGHEAAELGSLMAAQKDGDCFLFPYYRDLALKMAAGLTPRQVMLSFMGKDGEPYSGARQFPLQGADLPRNIIQISNVVAAGLTQSVGYALGCKMLGEDTVTLCYFGDGASSQGDCHEAMNFAAVHKLPVIFFCENNKYAISVPLDKQMAVESVASRASGYGMPGVEVDGCDTNAVFEATAQAAQRARAGQGPTLIEAHVERYLPHTSDDDDTRYRERAEIDEARKRDPLRILREQLFELGALTDELDAQFAADARRIVNEATEYVEAASYPAADDFHEHVYAEAAP